MPVSPLVEGIPDTGSPEVMGEGGWYGGCASCSTTTAVVYVEMKAGPDGLPWWLCSGCWA